MFADHHGSNGLFGLEKGLHLKRPVMLSLFALWYHAEHVRVCLIQLLVQQGLMPSILCRLWLRCVQVQSHAHFAKCPHTSMQPMLADSCNCSCPFSGLRAQMHCLQVPLPPMDLYELQQLLTHSCKPQPVCLLGRCTSVSTVSKQAWLLYLPASADSCVVQPMPCQHDVLLKTDNFM